MRCAPSNQRRSWWFVLLWLPLLCGSLTLCLLAQEPPPKTPPVEEEDTQAPRKPKVPVRVEEEEPGARRSQATPLAALQQEAEQAPSLALRKLYEGLAIPHDVVTYKDGHQKNVEPIAYYVGDHSGGTDSINVRFYDEKWQLGRIHPQPLSDLQRIDYYEEIALRQVDSLLSDTGAPSSGKPLSRLDRLRAADRILSAVLRFHETAHESHLREGTSWTGVEGRLRQRLQSVQLEQLKLLSAANEWQAAVDLASRLTRAYAGNQDVQTQVAEQLSDLVSHSLKEGHQAEAMLRLKVLGDQFPAAVRTGPLQVQRRRQASQLFEEAKKAEQSQDRARALQNLISAESIDPNLPGLHDYRLRLENKFPAPLGVGVRETPSHLSPATALTDAEKQAVELMFESLVKARYHQETGQSFEPQLTMGRPRVIPLGRKFQLARDAYWSNGEPVTAADVRATVQLLRRPGWAGYAPEWANLMEDPLPSQNINEVGLRLRQGFLEPLSLMTFKVLPSGRNLDAPDNPDFAEHPLGSGPFQYLETRDGEAVFVANPHYHRGDQTAFPLIREIHLFHSDDPPHDFQTGRLHLLLDLPTRGIRPLESVEGVTVKTYRNRRVYFLAINHRHPQLQNVELRKALAYAVNREQILNDVFRQGSNEPKPPHRPINSLYPPDTWAANPDPHVKPDLYNPLLARSSAKKAVNGSIRLSLKYPNDEDVRRACELIRDQVKELTGVELDLIACTPRDFHEQVEVQHDYDLAYCHYDYANEMYWLWPLFNPAPRGTSTEGVGNYLGYHNDGTLESEFQQAMNHREFAEVQRATHEVSNRLYERMVVVPLWQLDSHIASKGLIFPDLDNLDPLCVFGDVEKWQKQP